MATIKTRHAVLGVVLGILSGAFLTAMLVSSPVLLMPTLTVTFIGTMAGAVTIAISFLGVWAGLPSGVAASVSALFTAYSLGGGTLALAVFEAMVIPAWCVIMLIARRSRYYDGIKQSVAMQSGAVLVLVVGTWMTVGGDLSQYIMDSLRSAVDAYPGEYTNVMLSYWGQLGLFGGQTGLDFTKALTSAEQTSLLDAIFSASANEMRRSLASLILTGSVTAGAVSYALCASVVAKRGDDPIIDYAHPYDWRLSPSLIIGPPVCAMVFGIGYLLGMDGADSACLALYGLCVLLFCVQGIGAVDRRFKQTGATAAFRIFIIAILVITGLRELLAILGVISALFGSKGLISTAVKKRNDKGDGRQ